MNIGKHTHPGVESGYLIEGDFTLLVAGQPDRPLKTGGSYQIPAGAPHDARSGAQGTKVIDTYVVEKGKPLRPRLSEICGRVSGRETPRPHAFANPLR